MSEMNVSLPSPKTPSWHAWMRAPMAAIDTLFLWQERAGERCRLAQMNDWMLRDIGLSRAHVAREAELPFWRAS